MSCAWFNRDRGDAVDVALEAADELYAQRDDPARLDEAIGAYILVDSDAPSDPRVLVRLARSFAARAETLAGPAMRKELEIARAYGLECLATNPGFAARVELNGGRITRNVVRQLTREDGPCLEQTLYAWIRWAEARGPAAAVDLPALAALSERSADLGVGWVAPWSAAMVTLLKPGPLPQDLTVTRDQLDLAILLAPDRATAHADLIRWQLIREGDVAAFDLAVQRFPTTWPPTSDEDWALENRVARDRVAALAGQGARLVYDAWGD